MSPPAATFWASCTTEDKSIWKYATPKPATFGSKGTRSGQRPWRLPEILRNLVCRSDLPRRRMSRRTTKSCAYSPRTLQGFQGLSAKLICNIHRVSLLPKNYDMIWIDAGLMIILKLEPGSVSSPTAIDCSDSYTCYSALSYLANVLYQGWVLRRRRYRNFPTHFL